MVTYIYILIYDSLSTKALRWACSSAFHSSSSEYESNGSRLNLKLPENNTGSCGIIVRRERRECRPIFEILMWSMKIFPLSASKILQLTVIYLLFATK